MNLKKFGYAVTDNKNFRRQSLSYAVKDIGPIRTLELLSKKMTESESYKIDRLRADRNWLRNRVLKFRRFEVR